MLLVFLDVHFLGPVLDCGAFLFQKESYSKKSVNLRKNRANKKVGKSPIEHCQHKNSLISSWHASFL